MSTTNEAWWCCLKKLLSGRLWLVACAILVALMFTATCCFILIWQTLNGNVPTELLSMLIGMLVGGVVVQVVKDYFHRGDRKDPNGTDPSGNGE